jgi:hypothetical protein
MPESKTPIGRASLIQWKISAVATRCNHVSRNTQ